MVRAHAELCVRRKIAGVRAVLVGTPEPAWVELITAVGIGAQEDLPAHRKIVGQSDRSDDVAVEVDDLALLNLSVADEHADLVARHRWNTRRNGRLSVGDDRLG